VVAFRRSELLAVLGGLRLRWCRIRNASPCVGDLCARDGDVGASHGGRDSGIHVCGLLLLPLHVRLNIES